MNRIYPFHIQFIFKFANLIKSICKFERQLFLPMALRRFLMITFFVDGVRRSTLPHGIGQEGALLHSSN